MKGKSKKLPTLRSNSTKKLTMRNKSHPGHEINLDKMFAQMKTDILNEMKKVAEIKFNEHKVNILKLLNKSSTTVIPKKKIQYSTKSEKKEKKGKSIYQEIYHGNCTRSCIYLLYSAYQRKAALCAERQ